MILLAHDTSLSRLHHLDPRVGESPLLRLSTATFWQNAPDGLLRARLRELKGSLRVEDGEVEALAQGFARTHRDDGRRPGTLLVVLQVRGRLELPSGWQALVLVCAGSDLYCSEASLTVEILDTRLIASGVATVNPLLDHSLRENGRRLVRSQFPPRSRPSFPLRHDPDGLDLSFRLMYDRPESVSPPTPT